MVEYQVKGPVAAAVDGPSHTIGAPMTTSSSGRKTLTHGAKLGDDSRDRDRESKGFDDKLSSPNLLHSGRILGDLPSLGGRTPGSGGKVNAAASRDISRALQYGEGSPDMRADGKDRQSGASPR